MVSLMMSYGSQSSVALQTAKKLQFRYSRFLLRLNIVCCVWWLRIVWLGSVAKTINFHSYGTSPDQRGGSTYSFRGSL